MNELEKVVMRNLVREFLMKLMPERVVFFIDPQVRYYYIWNGSRFNNHMMALMLVDILHGQGMVNDTTYKKIMKKNLEHTYV